MTSPFLQQFLQKGNQAFDTADDFLQRPGGNFLMNLLAQSGFSTMPQSPFGAIGRAAQQTQADQAGSRRANLENRLLRARIGLTEAQTRAELDPTLNAADDPAAVREFNFVQTLRDGSTPDRTVNEETGMSPAERRYYQVQRGIRPLNVEGAGVIDPLTGEVLVNEETIQGGIGDRAGAETGGTAQEARIQGVIDEALANASTLPTLRRSIELLETVNTGGVLNQAQLAFARGLGIETGDQGELAANLGKAVLSQLRETFGAQFTEREGARLERIEAGFGKNNETNIRLLRNLQTLIQSEVNQAITLARARGDMETVQLLQDFMMLELGDDDAPAEQGTISFSDLPTG